MMFAEAVYLEPLVQGDAGYLFYLCLPINNVCRLGALPLKG
jgi:hypothetical protein